MPCVVSGFYLYDEEGKTILSKDQAGPENYLHKRAAQDVDLMK
jgi:hypothetical protein